MAWTCLVIESVALPPLDVKVFRKENAWGLPHFEGLPDENGFVRIVDVLDGASGSTQAAPDTTTSVGQINDFLT